MRDTLSLYDESIIWLLLMCVVFCCGLCSFKLTVFPSQNPGVRFLSLSCYTCPFSQRGLFNFTQHHAADSQPLSFGHIHCLQNFATVLHPANHPLTTVSTRHTPSTPHDHHHRGEPTPEPQHHNTRRRSSRTGAQRAPASSPNLHTPGPRTVRHHLRH